jgi:hypothetical protein
VRERRMLAPPILHRPVLEPQLAAREPHIAGAAKKLEERAVLERLGAGERASDGATPLSSPAPPSVRKTAARPGLDPGVLKSKDGAAPAGAALGPKPSERVRSRRRP